MIYKQPNTYNEIIRLKKCYTLANYYSNITENMFYEIYDFLGEAPDNSIVANQTVLLFVDGKGNVIKTFSIIPKNNSFDRININEKGISITNHYDSDSPSWSGSSGNNNNNNNNNNNS